TIICGEFNIYMETFTGDHDCNPIGAVMERRIHTYELILWNNQLAPGISTYVRHQGSSVVDFFLTTDELYNPSLTISEGLSLDSDHKMKGLYFQIITP
ncbi:MAG: hypothetical protein EXX96DRAFT_483029, partial [Benjaminiella poitrasii]